MKLFLRKTIFVLILAFLIVLFLLFNISSPTTVSFIFFEVQNVPLVLVIVFSFFLGSFFTLFLMVRIAWHKRKVQKHEEKARKKQEAEEKEEKKKQ